MNSRLNCWFAAAIVGLFSTFAVQANLIVNGGFEEPVVDNPPIHYVHLKGSELPGWTIVWTFKGTVLFNTGYDPVSEGSQAVQIEVPSESISQSFPTVSGQAYTLSFDLSAYSVYGGRNLGTTPCSPNPCASILGVTVGSIYEEFNGSSGGYVTNTLQFTADSSATTLKFENLYEGDGWGNYPHLDNVSVTAVPIIVTVDIKPGSNTNPINLRSRGKIPVAILTTDTFDATTVDPSTAGFGPAGATEAHDRGHFEDVDGDMDWDLVLHFKTQETGITCGEDEATLTGETSNGVQVTGTDSIKTVGCKKKGN